MKFMSRIMDARGMALVLTMWLLVLLVILASELVVSARSDLGAVRNFTEDRQAYFIARSGIHMAVNEIMQDSTYNYFYQEGQIRFAKGSDDENPPVFSSRAKISLGGGLLAYKIEDEDSKLNLNRLAKNSGSLETFLRTTFEGEIEDRDAILDSILDWVDSNDLHRLNGAEDSYYQSLEPPYWAKNSDFDTVSELKKVKGITDEVYNALAPHLTVYPTTGVNINTASRVVLQANGMSATDIDDVMDKREEEGYWDTVSKSEIFTVTSTGRFEGSSLVHVIKAVIKKTGDRSVKTLDWDDDYYIP